MSPFALDDNSTTQSCTRLPLGNYLENVHTASNQQCVHLPQSGDKEDDTGPIIENGVGRVRIRIVVPLKQYVLRPLYLAFPIY